MGASLGGSSANPGEVKEVWNSVDERNWSGLVSAVQKVRHAKGNTGTLDKIENYARSARSGGTEFPRTFNGLSQLMG